MFQKLYIFKLFVKTSLGLNLHLQHKEKLVIVAGQRIEEVILLLDKQVTTVV